MNLFYCTAISTDNTAAILSEEESVHAVRVLRIKRGEKIIFTDGKGLFYEGEIANPNPRKCEVKILRTIPPLSKRSFHLTIAIAPTKNIDRFEWFLEKATEIGCDEIVPVICRHSERTVIKTERLNKILVSSMKQCLKSQLPQLHEPADYRKFIAAAGTFAGLKFIGHIPELSGSEFPPQNPAGASLQSLCKKGENILIAIGPEGGFSEEEVALAVKTGFVPVSLGHSRLRVETAGVTACAVINSVNS